MRELIREYRAEHHLTGADESAEARGTGRRDGEFDLVVRGHRVMCGDHFVPREVGVRNGKIAAIEPLGAGLQGARVVELAEDETLLPGLVDTHVHVNEPGAPSGRASPPPPGRPRRAV